MRYHQPLRYFADESVGYEYPEAYRQFFGADYQPPEYIRRDHELARDAPLVHELAPGHAVRHLRLRARARDSISGMFEDIIGRNFRQPKEGLGFDGSPVAHMWRSMIWPNNFL